MRRPIQLTLPTMPDRLDLDLDPAPPPVPPDDPPASPSRAVIVAIAVLVACVSVAVWYFWSPGPADTPRPGEPAAGVATEGDVRDEGPPLGQGAAADLPPLDELDPTVRGMLEALSQQPELARLLATDNLLRRFVVSVERIGRGATPAGQVTVLRPEGQFSVERPYQETTVSAASHARYDGIVRTVAGLDAAAIARLYGQLRPRLEEAYAELGVPGESFDAAMARAITHLLEVSPGLARGSVRASKGVTYAYVDPAAENLSDAQKHLLRMGPAGAERVQQKLREIAAALGIAAERLPR